MPRPSTLALLVALAWLSAASPLAWAAQAPVTDEAPAARSVPVKPGLHERSLESGGQERAFLVKVPRGYKKNPEAPVPMVLMLHGRGSDGEQAASRYYGWSRLADREGFIAVFPTALGRPTSWQAAFRGRPTEDTRFLSELIGALVVDYAIDPERVFMTGHSSGGFMSYSFAALHPEQVAAIAPVAGLYLGAEGPSVPVSVIAFHGMADDVVAYDDEHGQEAAYRGMRSAVDSAAMFARSLAVDGTAPERRRTEIERGQVLLDTWADGPRGTRVELYSLIGWGHGWPTGRAEVGATRLIWAFFEEHGREPEEPDEREGPATTDGAGSAGGGASGPPPSHKGRLLPAPREACAGPA